MFKLSVIYRVCGSECNSQLRPERPPWFSKFKCWKSLHSSFINHSDIFVIWDGEKNELYDYIKGSWNVHIQEINEKNNQKSLIACYDLADSLSCDGVFFSEDDYLYLPNSGQIMVNTLPQLGILSLMDHPDRYCRNDDITLGKDIILCGPYCHFRSCESTTCTCAFEINLFKELKEKLVYFCNSGYGSPEDRKFYQWLFQNTPYRLFTSIPGYATHCVQNLLSPLVNWEEYNNSIEI